MKHLRTTVASLAALTLTAGVAAGALATEDAETTSEPEPVGVFSIEGLQWLLTAQLVDGEMTPVPEGVVVSLFMEDGQAGGTGGCNNYFADYELDGFDLTFGNIGATLMACPGPAGDVESAYFSNLGLVTSYQSGGIQMALKDENDEPITAGSAV